MTALPSTTHDRYHHGNVREAACTALRALIDEDGIAAVTVRSLAERVGVSHAALYRHVSSIDQLIDEVAADWLMALTASYPPDEPIAAFVHRYVERALLGPNIYTTALGRARGSSDSPRTARALTHLRDHARAVFTNEQPAAESTVIVHAVMRTWALIHGLLDLSSQGLLPTRSDRQLANFIIESALVTAKTY